MTHDPVLVERIKTNFARRSSAHLRQIAESTDRDRWSAEAVAAAHAVLADRDAGRAAEPDVPADEPPPPSVHYEADDVGGVVGVLGLLAGVGIVTYYRIVTSDELDLPVPFGPNTAW